MSSGLPSAQSAAQVSHSVSTSSSRSFSSADRLRAGSSWDVLEGVMVLAIPLAVLSGTAACDLLEVPERLRMRAGSGFTGIAWRCFLPLGSLMLFWLSTGPAALLPASRPPLANSCAPC